MEAIVDFKRERLPMDQRIKVQLDAEQMAFVLEQASRDRCSIAAAVRRVITEKMLEKDGQAAR